MARRCVRLSSAGHGGNACNGWAFWTVGDGSEAKPAKGARAESGATITPPPSRRASARGARARRRRHPRPRPGWRRSAHGVAAGRPAPPVRRARGDVRGRRGRDRALTTRRTGGRTSRPRSDRPARAKRAASKRGAASLVGGLRGSDGLGAEQPLAQRDHQKTTSAAPTDRTPVTRPAAIANPVRATVSVMVLSSAENPSSQRASSRRPCASWNATIRWEVVE
jgi:hypothetical protein